jgi:hypothetical protein
MTRPSRHPFLATALGLSLSASVGSVSLVSVSLGAVSLASLVWASGCSKPPPRTTANVKAGDLDPRGDWTGVFYSPLFGHLHLIKEGNSVSGKWRTVNGDRWGEMHGAVTGDLMKYKWVEHKIGMVGPSATTEGRGYFKYVVPPGENENHEIVGEWGLGQSEVGNPWNGIRQRNMLPDPDSVAPDETERVNMPDEWDQAPSAPQTDEEEPAGDEAGGEGDM